MDQPNSLFPEFDEKPNRMVVKLHWPYSADYPHYDLRLQNGPDTAASFCVPKGPSMDPAVKRLAIRTGDHGLNGFSFEGVHPAGRPGHGVTLIWDEGTYRCLAGPSGNELPLEEALKSGRALIEFNGQKLMGLFEFHRMEGDHWLLVKMPDLFARPGSDVTSEMPLSVETERTLEEVETDWYRPLTGSLVDPDALDF